jgi:glycerol kinase
MKQEVLLPKVLNLQTNYFENGFVEQDPEEIYQNVLASVRKCLLQFTGKDLMQKISLV